MARKSTGINLAGISGVSLVFISAVGSAGISFINQTMLARLLPISQYGEVSSFLSLSNQLSPIINFGIAWFLIQKIAESRSEAEDVVRKIPFSIIFNTSIAAFLASSIIMYKDKGFRLSELVIIIMMSLSGPLIEIAAVKWQVGRRYVPFALAQSIIQITRCIIIFLLYLMNYVSYLNILVLFSVASIVIAIYSLYELIAWGSVGGVKATIIDNFKGAIVLDYHSFPYGMMTFLSIIPNQGLVVLSGIVLGHEEAAIYNIVILLLYTTYLFPSIVFMKILIAPISRWEREDYEMFGKAFGALFCGAAVCGIVGMGVVVIGSELIVDVLFGEKYFEAPQFLRVISVCIPFRFVGSCLGSVMFSPSYMTKKIILHVISVIITIIVIFSPYHGLTLYTFVYACVAFEVTLVLSHLCFIALYRRDLLRNINPFVFIPFFRSRFLS